jgi:hypothetical protein
VVLADVFARIHHDFDSFEFHSTALHDAGETVIVEGRHRARAAAISDILDAEVCRVWTPRGRRADHNRSARPGR